MRVTTSYVSAEVKRSWVALPAQVKTWVLMNEPHIYCTGAYESTWMAPGLNQAGTGGYGCVHNMILAHAKAYHLYNDTYRATQGGTVKVFIAIVPVRMRSGISDGFDSFYVISD